MKKILLSLDLDETLIHSLSCNENKKEFEYDFLLSNDVPVIKRPMLNYFMSFIDKNKNIEYGFFSKAGSQYVKEIVSEICSHINKKPLFILDYNSMTTVHNDSMYCSGYNEPGKIKDLKKIKKYSEDGFKRMIAIDDLMNYPRQRGNVIMVKPFEGNKEDKELLKIKKIISFLIEKDNVRDYIKNYTVDNNIMNKKNFNIK